MTSTARATAGSPESHPLAGLVGPRDKADPIDRVVALFSGPVPSAPPEEEDWSASLIAVRGVATRVRTLQKSAHDAMRDAQRSVREAQTAARAAGARADHAETLLREAIARAERAEAQARAAGERADRAEAQTAEARAWLRRMHECMVSEFGPLAQDAVEP